MPSRPWRLGRSWGFVWWPGAWLWVLAASAVFGVLLLAVLVAILFPAQIERVASELATEPGLAFLAGVALWMVIPPLIVAMVISIVGIMAIAFLPFVLAVLCAVGVAGVSMFLGRRFSETLKRARDPVLETVLGAVALGVLVLIPGLGGVVFFLAATWGAGAVLVLALRRFRQAPQTAT